MCIPSCTGLHLDQIQYHHKYTLVMGKSGFIVNLEALHVGFLGGSVLKVDISGAANKKERLQVLDCK